MMTIAQASGPPQGPLLLAVLVWGWIILVLGLLALYVAYQWGKRRGYRAGLQYAADRLEERARVEQAQRLGREI